MLTYRCRDVLFSPKKRGLQDKDFNRNLGLSLLWQGTALQRAAAVSTSCPQSIRRGRDALELRVFRWSCVEKTKCGTKQSEDLHRFCWLHFCKEVLGSLLKVCHRTGMPEVARGWVIRFCFTGIKSVHDPVLSWHFSTPCKIWGSNGRLDWKHWRHHKLTMSVANIIWKQLIHWILRL